MANGKIRFGKQSGGQLALVIPDGVDNTEVIVPESGILATKQYVDDNTLLSPNDSRVKTALNATGTAPIYASRAWVNFNGTGTVAIRASGNVSSITDNGTGDYTVNFTTAMPDVNYATNVTTCNRIGEGAFGMGGLYGQTTGTVSGIRVATFNPSEREDFVAINVSIFR